MKISRLRLLGFKSFVDPTELVIEQGLTGVVGPNGCGKSNLLEALRWVMGETSHKSMRASAMDDVIFSGSQTRPARNSAEVTMFLDNSARRAPAEYNDDDTVEITRRIEREAGSAYRINGRDARARDVRILFEDAATGARSPALVRQGQIGEIVNAKPEARRRILEDAAGIAGLHSRRHEAELRLKAADANLLRLRDVLGQLGSQLESLKRQARSARRYKEISGEIRRLEAILLHLAWAEAQGQVDAEERALAEAQAHLGAVTQTEAAAIRQEAASAEAIGPLREAEAVRAAVLQRLKIEQETLEKEAERAAERRREIEARAHQLARDLEREIAQIEEADAQLARLSGESEALESTTGEPEVAEAEARAGIERFTQEQSEAATQLAELESAINEARARRRELESARGERQGLVGSLQRQLAEIERQMQEARGKAPDARKAKALIETGALLADEVQALEEAISVNEEATARAADEVRGCREAAVAMRLAAKQLETEVATLAKLLRAPSDSPYVPIVDGLAVSPGYEIALGAALGDDLEAATDPAAPLAWLKLAQDDVKDARLPVGATPLIDYVEAPAALKRRLRQIGVVARENGHRLQGLLKAGQRLVSVEGDLWRWDGFRAAAHAPSAAAVRLAERNRLAGLEERLETIGADVAAAGTAEAEAQARHQAAEAEQRRLRQLLRDKQGELAATREALTRTEQAARECDATLRGLAEGKTRAAAGLQAAEASVAEIAAAIDGLVDVDVNAEEIENRRRHLETCRNRLSEARAEAAAHARERQLRQERLKALAAERTLWQSRQAGSRTQCAALEERSNEARQALAELEALPVLIEERRSKLLTTLSEAERDRTAAANRLAEAETAVRQAGQALRESQAAVSSAREARARLEARLEAARERRSEETRRIRETLDCAPDGCLAVAGVEEGKPLPALADADRQLARLKADRERLGGVNLQAEEELTARAGEFEAMDRERADLEEAIAKLRAGIGQLNREGRKRLMEAFDTVNGHFKRLFSVLFGGGEAELQMIEGDDPLEGGLEIMAKPPGKKPNVMSLLSGGEQTLTALSLIFAVFLTNPSPICVLDEVDAPLDDANVDRFCSMMERMASETDTRFLVITHHPMTMARMQRLFGVTMGERGVSQLVSVDLAAAERIIESGEDELRRA
ncbi:MAG: chromosome segregation protein SMC [Hyphomicrobiaceae bacterium]